jgi:flagellar biosynthesis GTPase FlhF
LAAYYKQIKDDKTVQMFNEVRLRAWRRIGKLFDAVDLSKCLTQSDKIRTIRASFDDGAMIGISDSRIREIMQLSAVSDASFEHAMNYKLTGSIPDLLLGTPEHQEQARRQQEQNAAAARREPTPEEIEREAQQAAKEKIDREREALEERHFEELDQAATAAMGDVGITLERKDRTRMKQVVFLIKNEVHTVMRQAAFDKKVTMQEVLRRGLKMWLAAHDYDWPLEGHDK